MVSSGAAGRRLSTITLDQAISSASNVLVAVLAARVLDTAAFGLFGIVFLTYVTVQGVVRALAGEPLLARSADAEEHAVDAIGIALMLGAAGGVLLGLVALACVAPFPSLAAAFALLAVATPLLVLQDLGRYLAFSTHRPARALVLDTTWLVLVVGAAVAISLGDLETLPWFVLAWAGTGALSGLLVLRQYRVRRVPRGVAWLRETWPISWRYLVSYSSTQASVLGASVALAGIAGARALGAVRGALLLLGPFVQFQAASVAAGVTEVARMPSGDPAIHRHVRRSSLLTGVAAVLVVAVLLVLPDRLGELVLGDTWSATHALLVPAGLQMLLLSSISGPRSALLGLRHVRTTLRIDIATTVITFATPLPGAVVNGAVGAFWGLAIGQGVIAVIWWSCWLRAARHGAAAATPSGHVEPVDVPVGWPVGEELP